LFADIQYVPRSKLAPFDVEHITPVYKLHRGP